MWYLVIFQWSTINRGLCFMGLHLSYLGPSWSWSDGSLIYNYLCNHSLSPLKLSVRIPLMVRCTRYNICDKVCQWLVTGQWFSLVTPVSSTNKTDRHDITELLLKVGDRHEVEVEEIEESMKLQMMSKSESRSTSPRRSNRKRKSEFWSIVDVLQPMKRIFKGWNLSYYY